MMISIVRVSVVLGSGSGRPMHPETLGGAVTTVTTHLRRHFGKLKLTPFVLNFWERGWDDGLGSTVVNWSLIRY